MITYPIILTYARIILVGMMLFSYIFVPKNMILVTVLFLLGAFTDWLDGFLARKLKQETKFGAFLDPVADKILVTATLFFLVEHFHHKILTTLSALVVIRELSMSALRQWASETHQLSRINVDSLGKLKTAFQMIALTVLLFYSFLATSPFLFDVGLASLGVACAITWYSFVNYIKKLAIVENKKDSPAHLE